MADHERVPEAGADGKSEAEGYERPSLTPLGNARDLLAGATGSVNEVDPLQPTRPGP